MIKRRDFLKIMGGATAGSIVLSSCGGSGGNGSESAAPIPNGYIFYRLTNSGDALPESGTTDHFPKAVLINERPEIVFCAVDSEGAKGYYRLSMDFSGNPPQIVSSHKVVRVGDMLADSLSVVNIHNVDLNDAGTFAAILATDDNLSGIYLDRQGKGLEPTVKAHDSTPELEASFGSMFLDVDIHDDDNVMFVSHYAYKTKGGAGQGLFHLPGGELGARGDLLLSTGEDIPEATGVVNGLGLIDMHDDGNYVLQAFGHNSGNVNAAAKGQGQPATMLIKGSVREPLSRTLRASSPSIRAGKSAAARLGFSYGEMNYGPRIGIGGRIASVHQISEHDLVLMYEGIQIASTRGGSPLGNIITGFGGPVIGEDRILYYQTYHDLAPGVGSELVAFNGKQYRTILTTGDLIDERKISRIWFGFMTEQVDSRGRIVFSADFEDGTSSIVVGIPI